MLLKNTLLNIAKAGLFIGFGTIILYLLYQKQSADYQLYCNSHNIPAASCSLVQKILTDFRNTNFFWIGMVIIAFMISNISRTIRWFMLINSLGYQPKFFNGFFSIMLGYFANLGFPRIGEVIRAGTLSRYERIPTEQVFGTVVVDRLMDLLALACVMVLGFLLEFDTLWTYVVKNPNLNQLASKFNLLGVGLLGLLVLAFVTWIFRKQLAQSKLAQKVKGLIVGFGEGIQTIRRLKRPGWFIFHSINIWFMYYLMTYLAFFAFAPTTHLTPVVALVVFLFGALGIVIPSPGGMGAYQGLVTTALALYGIDPNDGFSLSNILFFTIQIGCNTFFGILALILLPIYNRKLG